MEPTMDPGDFACLGIYVPGEVSSFSTDSNVILAIFVIKLKDPTLDSIPKQEVPKVAAPGKSGSKGAGIESR